MFDEQPDAGPHGECAAEIRRLQESTPDDIRAAGWAVAVHNDYRLHGEPHTFWLFTKEGRCVKGEGISDAEALGQIRAGLRLMRELPADGVGSIAARAAEVTMVAPSLWPVIQWLEGGCDPKEAAKELRIYAERMGQTAAGVAPSQAPSRVGVRYPAGDRPSTEPGGCQCVRCGCIFIGSESHTECAECAAGVKTPLEGRDG